MACRDAAQLWLRPVCVTVYELCCVLNKHKPLAIMTYNEMYVACVSCIKVDHYADIHCGFFVRSL